MLFQFRIAGFSVCVALTLVVVIQSPAGVEGLQQGLQQCNIYGLQNLWDQCDPAACTSVYISDQTGSISAVSVYGSVELLTHIEGM